MQPPDPLRERDLLQFTIRQRAPSLCERDLLQFTIRQRRTRPAATTGDRRRPRNRQTL